MFPSNAYFSANCMIRAVMCFREHCSGLRLDAVESRVFRGDGGPTSRYSSDECLRTECHRAAFANLELRESDNRCSSVRTCVVNVWWLHSGPWAVPVLETR